MSIRPFLKSLPVLPGILLGLAWPLAAPAAGAQLPRYEVLELPLPENLYGEGGFRPVGFDADDPDAPRPVWSTEGIALNDERTVIGNVRMRMSGFGTESARPVLWKRHGGAFRGQLLPQLPRGSTRLVDLNEDGVVIGYATRGGREVAPFILDGRKVVRPLEHRAHASWTPTAINDDGLVVGFHSADARGRGPSDLVLYHYRRGRSDASCVLEGVGRPFGVNAHGWVVGQDARGDALLLGPVSRHGRLRDCEALERLEAIPWTGSRVLRLLDDAYRAVGASGAEARRATIWDEPAVDPGTGRVIAGDPVHLGFRVRAWNAGGTVVGTAGSIGEDAASGNEVRSRAMIWKDGREAGLGARVSARSGWTLETAADINERGWITGRGRFRPEGSTRSVVRGYVLSPR